MYHYIDKCSEVERSLLLKAILAHFGPVRDSAHTIGSIADGVAYAVRANEERRALFGTNPEATARLDSFMAGYQTGRLALDKMIDSVVDSAIADADAAAKDILEGGRDTEPVIKVRVDAADTSCPFPDCQGHEPIEEE